MGLFKEPKTKFTLLSIFSALVVVSTAFAGISIYAQTDDSELTTFEEEAIAAGEEFEDMTNATSDDGGANATDETMTAELQALFEGLIICDVGTAEVSGETEVAALDDAALETPTVSVTLMTETEVAEAAANETETASADETEVASANCIRVGSGGDETSTSNTTDSTNATSTASNATSDGNATGVDDSELTTSEEEALAGEEADNATSTSTSAIDSGQQILVVEGQDFVEDEVVLVFSDNNLVAIDDVDSNGEIEAKVPVTDPESQLRLVESGTTRTAEFYFDGETLLPSDNEGEIQVEGSEDDAATPTLEPAPSGNATSTANSTSSNYTVQ